MVWGSLGRLPYRETHGVKCSRWNGASAQSITEAHGLAIIHSVGVVGPVDCLADGIIFASTHLHSESNIYLEPSLQRVVAKISDFVQLCTRYMAFSIQLIIPFSCVELSASSSKTSLTTLRWASKVRKISQRP